MTQKLMWSVIEWNINFSFDVCASFNAYEYSCVTFIWMQTQKWIARLEMWWLSFCMRFRLLLSRCQFWGANIGISFTSNFCSQCAIKIINYLKDLFTSNVFASDWNEIIIKMQLNARPLFRLTGFLAFFRISLRKLRLLSRCVDMQ